MKKLGIIGAMKVEVETLQNAMTGKKIQTIAGMDFCEGLLEGLPAVVVECGVARSMRQCARKFFAPAIKFLIWSTPVWPVL